MGLRLLIASVLFVGLAPAQSTVELSLSANGQTELTWYRGWPLLLEASAWLVEGEQATLDWPGPLRVTIQNAAGAAQSWPIEALDVSAGPAVLTESQAASAVWGVTAEATGAIAAGDYVLTVQHPAAGASRRVQLKVAAPPGSASADEEMLRSRVESRYLEFQGDLDGALSVLGRALMGKSDDIAGLVQQADLLEGLGRLDGGGSCGAGGADGVRGAVSERVASAAGVDAEVGGVVGGGSAVAGGWAEARTGKFGFGPKRISHIPGTIEMQRPGFRVSSEHHSRIALAPWEAHT